jgi:hypothetical protein
MTCAYRRKRITAVPDDAARELDDEYSAIGQAIDCLQENAGGMDEVKDDTTPELGGPLHTLGQHIVITDNADVPQGVLTNKAEGGAVLIATNAAGEWESGKAWLGVIDGDVRLAGVTTTVDSLIGSGVRDVMVSATGVLSAVAPGTGPGTDLSIANATASSFWIASSTGADVELPAGTNVSAGIVTAAQVARLEAAVLTSDTRIFPLAHLYGFNAVIQGTTAYSLFADQWTLWTQITNISTAVNSGITFNPATFRFTVANDGIYLINVNFGFRADPDALLRYILFGVALASDFNAYSRIGTIVLPANAASTYFTLSTLAKLAPATEYVFTIGKAVSLNGDTPQNVAVANIKYLYPNISMHRVG